MFKLKDLFTLLNIICGYISILFTIEGEISYAAIFIFLGFLADMLDGPVARLLKQGNKFGAEFDNVADLITYSVAPSFLAYIYLKQSNLFLPPFNIIVPALISAFPIVTGCIRFARFNVHRVEYPGIWFGLPRPVTALFIISIILSHFADIRAVQILFVAIVLISTLLNVSKYPYIGHHNANWDLKIKIAVGLYLLTLLGLVTYSLISVIFFNVPLRDAIKLVADVLFVILFIYTFFSSALGIPKDEWKKIKEFIKKWSREESEF